MTSEHSWARHYQHEWQGRAGDRRLPYWLRVAALAYGSHADNGHARFKRGEIALVLGEVDRGTGEVRPYENVGRAIRDAVEYGWLDPASFWGCLVVPAHAVKKGSYKSNAQCPIHVRRKRRDVAKPSLSERFDSPRLQPVTVSDLEAVTQRAVRSVDPSLCSVLTSTPVEGPARQGEVA